MPCGLINEIMPNEEYITEVKTVRTHMKLNLIQDSACFSMQDCMDGIVALAWEDISEYEEYPSEGRICIFFGENINDVGRKLAIKQTILM